MHKWGHDEESVRVEPISGDRGDSTAAGASRCYTFSIYAWCVKRLSLRRDLLLFNLWWKRKHCSASGRSFLDCLCFAFASWHEWNCWCPNIFDIAITPKSDYSASSMFFWSSRSVVLQFWKFNRNWSRYQSKIWGEIRTSVLCVQWFFHGLRSALTKSTPSTVLYIGALLYILREISRVWIFSVPWTAAARVVSER